MSARYINVMKFTEEQSVAEATEEFRKRYEGIYKTNLERYRDAIVLMECYRLKQTVLSSDGTPEGDIAFKYEVEAFPEWQQLQEELKQGREAIEKLKQLEEDGII